MAHDPAPSILAALEARGQSAPRVRLNEVPDESSPTLAEVELRPGARFDVLGQIAQGGVGRVVKGRDVDLGRDVALKVLLEKHLDNTDLVRRFVEEAQIGGQLQHPGIVPVYELGLLPDRQPFFAMKLVKGKTLAALLTERGSPEGDRRHLLSVFEKVCRTMAYAHSRGVIHRDLKPSNVMVGAFGEVQILDWGFAKVLEQGGIADERRRKLERADITRIATLRSEGVGSESIPGSVMGTPAYMPPEQALGHIEEMDERSDVFSLGAILTELLTGDPPYAGAESPMDCILMAIQGDVQAALERLDSCGADPALTDLAKRCLSALRKDRPRDADEMAAAVSDYLTEIDARAHRSRVAAEEARAKAEKEHARAARAREKAETARIEALHLRKKRRQTIALAASIVLALLIGGGAWAWLAGDRHTQAQEAGRAVNEALKEAAHARGEGDLPKALALATKARDLAEAQGADEETRGRVSLLLEEVGEASRIASEKAVREARTAELVRGLDEIRASRGWDDLALDESYAGLFREYGIDVGALSTEVAAARIKDLGRAQEIAAALDDWAWLRRVKRSLEDRDWRALVAVAKAADPDPWRSRLRDAVVDREPDQLRRLAEEARDQDLPARTLDLLGMALWKSDDLEEAVEFLRASRMRHPEDPWLNFHTAFLLGRLDSPRWEEAVPYATAAVALRPANSKFRHGLGTCLQEAGESEAAIAAFRSSIEVLPDSAFAYMGLAQTLSNTGHYDEALVAARKAVDLSPDHSESWAMLGQALDGQGEYEDALEAFDRALDIDEDSPQALVYRGHSLLKLHRPEEALPFNEKAVSLNPRWWAAHLVLGEVLLELGKPAEALRRFEKADELAPRSPHILVFAGNAQFTLGAWAKAIEYYQRAIKIDPGSSLAHMNLSVCLMRKGELDGALSEARSAVRVADAEYSAMAHSNLASALWETGQGDDALKMAQHAVELDEGCDAAHVALGRIRWGRNEIEEAREAFRTALRLNQRHPEALNSLGVLSGREGDLSAAIRTFERLVGFRPDHVQGRYNLGTVLVKDGNPGAAIPHFEEIIRMDPRHFDAHGQLSWALSLVGRLDEAVEVGRKMVGLRPDSAKVHRLLAQALKMNGDHEASLEEYREAHRLAPEEVGYINALAWELTSCANPELRDLDEAKLLAEKAVALAPENPYVLGTVGVIRLLAGNPDGARSALEKSVPLHKDARAAACDRLYLAKALFQLGEKEGAQAAYRLAMAWIEKQESVDTETSRILAEAETALGIPRTEK